MKRYAAIDIGTNAVRLLIKSVSEENGNMRFQKELLVRVPLRLGFDVFVGGRISEAKAGRLKHLMKSFRQMMKVYAVDRYRACATSAMRDAVNGAEIIRMIRKKCGIDIDIIDGSEEARMVYDTHIEQFGSRRGSLLYVDVGGGSTEVNLLTDGELRFSQSFNIGTVRMLAGSVADGEWDSLRKTLAEQTAGLNGVDIVGSGGNINKIYKLVSNKDKRYKRLTVNAVRALHEKIAPMSMEERMAHFDLKPDRADVIVPAMDIFLTVAEVAAAEHIYVPQIGLSDGIIDGLYMADRAAAGQSAE